MLAGGMTQRPLHDLLAELESTLRSGGHISPEDRALLERVHVDLEVALASQPPAAGPAEPHSLRDNIRAALDRMSAKHPKLSSLLSRTLDTLSDLGV